MSRVFFILSILILFVQNIFSADEVINLKEYIYLKDTQWRASEKGGTVTVKEFLDKYIPQQIKDKSITIIEVDSSKSEEKLYDILELKNIPLALEKSFLPIVNFHIDFIEHEFHDNNSFTNININPILIDQKISFNIDTNEFQKLKNPFKNRWWLWFHLYFDKIKVSSIAEEEFVPASETNKKYALTQDISTNNIVVVNANEEHLKTLKCLNPDFKIFNVEEVIDIEINQINVILKEDTKVYFKDRYFGSITNKVENSKISIKIDKSFCPPNKFVCLHDSISFSKWDDIVKLELKDKSNSEKRKICENYKDYFPEEIKDYFKGNKDLAPKIKIINKTNNKISIESVILGTNVLEDVTFGKEIDLSPYDLNNQSTIKVEYQADNECPDCKEKNLPNSTGELNYDIYSQDDVIEISLDEIDTSNLSNPKVEITNLPKDVKVSFNNKPIDPNQLISVTNHTDSIILKFEKEGYETSLITNEFRKLHFNDVEYVNCKDVNMKRTPWPEITITNKGKAKAEVRVKIRTEEPKPISIEPEELKSIPIDSNDIKININNINIIKELDQDKIQVLIKCQGNEYKPQQPVSRGGEEIVIAVEGKSFVETLGEDKIKDILKYLDQLATTSREHDVDKARNYAIKRIKEKLNELKKTHSISEEDLKELLNQPMKNGELMTEENRKVILEKWDEVQSKQQKKE